MNTPPLIRPPRPSLRYDQKPDSSRERARITAAGGFVSLAPEPGMPARVWLDASMTQCGLAMTRSLGDHLLEDAGVVPVVVVATAV